jgi:putative N6-adenine-specific DNA methylase
LSELLFLSATPGLENVLLEEARTLGRARPTRGGVELSGPIGLHRRANLWLRTASRVRLRHAGGEAIDEDTSGELLYRRGWRQEISRAPLRETLAAGMLLEAGYDGREALWDPLCGSGTIVLEAASIALARAPGLSRHFAFERRPGHDEAAWRREVDAARGRSAARAPIWGSDLNAGSLGTARRNARRAGFTAVVGFFRHDATKPWAEVPARGLLIANLPYGKRVGRGIEALYHALGEAFRQLEGWRCALLVEAREAERWLGLTPERVVALDNGGLRCRLLLGRFRV